MDGALYVVDDDVPVGVPLITHVEASTDNPDGSVGELEHAVTLAPLLDSVDGVTDIAIPTDPFVPVELLKLIVGTLAATLKLTVAVVDPIELVAVIV